MNKSRRAVSEIIGSMVLLAITVVGGILAWIVIVDSDVMSGISDQVLESAKSAGAVKIIGFDTRNGCNLLGIGVLDNVTGDCASADADGDKLCTVTCSANGNDTIMVKIRNTSTGTIFINSVLVNEVNHVFDDDTAGVNLDAVNQPSAGEYSIISTSNSDLEQFSLREILDGQDARLIIKLDSAVNGSDDIELTEGIRINISASEFEVDTFIIPAGTTR